MLTIGTITILLSFSISSGHELTNAVQLLENIVEILEYSVGKDQTHHDDEEIYAKIDRLEQRLEQIENGMHAPSPNRTCKPCPNRTCTHCPDKWMRFKGSCYLIVDKALNFNQAKANCIAQDAYLVHVNDENENTFLKGHLETLKGSNYMMGLTDADKEGQFKWDGGDDLLPFTDWDAGEPNDGPSGAEDCASFAHSKNYKWNDNDCKQLLKSICEKSV